MTALFHLFSSAIWVGSSDGYMHVYLSVHEIEQCVGRGIVTGKSVDPRLEHMTSSEHIFSKTIARMVKYLKKMFSSERCFLQICSKLCCAVQQTTLSKIMNLGGGNELKVAVHPTFLL
jgi:hypothetical protein